MLPFSVKKKYVKGPEQLVASFNDMSDAKAFALMKLQQDQNMKVETVYMLYDMGELMESFDQSTDTGSSGGGQQQSSGFRPNPLQTNLRPGGLPPSSFDDEKK